GPSPGIAGRQIRLQRSELDPLALDGGGGTRLPDFLAELLEPFERLGSRAIALPVQGLLGAGGVGGFARRDRDELGKVACGQAYGVECESDGRRGLAAQDRDIAAAAGVNGYG